MLRGTENTFSRSSSCQRAHNWSTDQEFLQRKPYEDKSTIILPTVSKKTPLLRPAALPTPMLSPQDNSQVMWPCSDYSKSSHLRQKTKSSSDLKDSSVYLYGSEPQILPSPIVPTQLQPQASSSSSTSPDIHCTSGWSAAVLCVERSPISMSFALHLWVCPMKTSHYSFSAASPPFVSPFSLPLSLPATKLPIHMKCLFLFFFLIL